MFADMAWWRKAIYFVLLVCSLPFILPLASALIAFLYLYEYEHLLVFSMLWHGVEPLKALSGVGCSFAVFGLYLWGIFKLVSPKHSIYGDARLATKRETKKKGIYDIAGTSIIIGAVGKRLVAFNDDLHVFLAAMTGSGKGVSFVIPNLLNWSDSLIAIDIKRELHAVTSWYRHHVLKNKVCVFEPLAQATDCFNPLSYISSDPDLQIDSLQKIAHSLIPIDDPYFDGQARVLFIGLMQLLLESHAHLGWQCSIGQVLKLLGTEAEIGEFLRSTIERLESDGVPLSARCRSNLFGFINEPEKPRGSIRSSLVNHLQLWANPRIDRATSHSSFDFNAFRTEKHTLYLVASPNDMKRLAPLFKLLFDSFLEANTRPAQQPSDNPALYQYQVLLMLDEFISLGAAHNLVHALSYVRGWGIKVATVIQSSTQLQANYDQPAAEAFEDGHRARIFFRPSRTSKTAATELADTLGRYTGKSGSVSRPSVFASGGNRSVSQSDTDLYLFTPDQIRNMPDQRCFLMVDGVRPIYGKKITYYNDKRFTAKLHEPISLPQPLLTGDSIYPEEGILVGNSIYAVQPSDFKGFSSETTNAIASIVCPAVLDESNIDSIADQLLTALESTAH